MLDMTAGPFGEQIGPWILRIFIQAIFPARLDFTPTVF